MMCQWHHHARWREWSLVQRSSREQSSINLTEEVRGAQTQTLGSVKQEKEKDWV